MNVILLGYDGTEESKRALERAIELAKAFQAKLLVTSVAPTAQAAACWSMGALDPDDPPERHQAELEEAAAMIRAAGQIRLAAASNRPPGGDDRPDRAR